MTSPVVTSTGQPWDPEVIAATIDELSALRADLVELPAHLRDRLQAVHPDHAAGATNLIHYVGLRRHDLRVIAGPARLDRRLVSGTRRIPRPRQRRQGPRPAESPGGSVMDARCPARSRPASVPARSCWKSTPARCWDARRRDAAFASWSRSAPRRVRTTGSFAACLPAGWTAPASTARTTTRRYGPRWSPTSARAPRRVAASLPHSVRYRRPEAAHRAH